MAPSILCSPSIGLSLLTTVILVLRSVWLKYRNILIQRITRLTARTILQSLHTASPPPFSLSSWMVFLSVTFTLSMLLGLTGSILHHTQQLRVYLFQNNLRFLRFRWISQQYLPPHYWCFTNIGTNNFHLGNKNKLESQV